MNKALIVLLVLLKATLVSCQDTTALTIEIKTKKEYELKFSKKHYDRDVKTYGYEITSDSVSEKRFDIDVAIKNNSTKSVYVWIMSCSWEDNFLINNDYIFITGHSCNKNIAKLVEIKPGKSQLYNSILIKSIKFDYPCKYCIYGNQVETTKLGLIVISDIFKHEYIDYRMFMEDKSKWSIIWSNPLYLLGKQPEPRIIDVFKN